MKSILTLFFLSLLSAAVSAQCPAIAGCPGAAVDNCDLTPNDPLLWNETYWLDTLSTLHDLADAPQDLQITAEDICTGGSSLSFRYFLFLDLNQDGIQETVVNSDSLATYAPGTLPFGNSANPNYGGGTPRHFDERAVATDQMYRFALQVTANGNNSTAYLRWNTDAAPGTYVNPQLPYGTHKIRWIVANSLGDQDTCEFLFTVRDCKKPTVVCINGLNISIMSIGSVSLWATDFLQYQEDNHTPTNLLTLGIRKSGAGTGFPVNSDGTPQVSVTFNCGELGTQLIELWSIDRSGNADYCETYVVVQDNAGFCGNNPMTYIDARFCARQWCNNATVPAAIELLGLIGLPVNGFHLDAEGCSVIDTPIMNPSTNITVVPTLDTDPLNGVDVLDLIRISQHILGVTPLLSPYSMIAADANKSTSITVFDIVEIQKTMLGIYTEFPNNTSWRFIDGDFVFPNPSNPFQSTFPEDKQLASLTDSLIGDFTFWAIKIGDVDCTAIPGLQGGEPETRGVTSIQLQDRSMDAGESYDLPVYPSEAGDWLGMQFGIEFDPALLGIETVLPGSLPNWNAANAAQPHPGLLNVLWFDTHPSTVSPDQPLFWVRVKARVPLQLRNTIRLVTANTGLLPGVYDGAFEPRRLDLQFLPDVPEASGLGNPFPNPTTAGAIFPLQLPANTLVRLELWDMQGRQTGFYETRGSGAVQQLQVPATAFPAPGLYSWRLSAGDRVKSGKILVER